MRTAHVENIPPRRTYNYGRCSGKRQEKGDSKRRQQAWAEQVSKE